MRSLYQAPALISSLLLHFMYYECGICFRPCLHDTRLFFFKNFNLLRKCTSAGQIFSRYRVNSNRNEYLHGSVSDSCLKLCNTTILSSAMLTGHDIGQTDTDFFKTRFGKRRSVVANYASKPVTRHFNPGVYASHFLTWSGTPYKYE